VKSHDNLSLTFHGPKWWSNTSNTLWVTLLRLWVMPTLITETRKFIHPIFAVSLGLLSPPRA
jgi:hypothetical protein